MILVMNWTRKVIAIDGYVATGKGTTAQWVAKMLWYMYLDTGAMYRAVTLYAIQHNLLESSEEEKAQMMSQIQLSFQYNSMTNHADIYLNGENVESSIRDTWLSLLMKPIVTSPAVRTALVQQQRIFWSQWWIVADGRDMGTIVFPEADLKIFLVCDAEIRAQRRFHQLDLQGKHPDLNDIVRDIQMRDQTDYLWPDAVNYQAKDALVIDTSVMTIDGQIQAVVDLLDKKIHNVNDKLS